MRVPVHAIAFVPIGAALVYTLVSRVQAARLALKNRERTYFLETFFCNRFLSKYVDSSTSQVDTVKDPASLLSVDHHLSKPAEEFYAENDIRMWVPLNYSVVVNDTQQQKTFVTRAEEEGYSLKSEEITVLSIAFTSAKSSRVQILMQIMPMMYLTLRDVEADLSLVVECWNFAVSSIHAVLLSVVMNDKRVVDRGGVGDLDDDWLRSLCTAEVLMQSQFNIFSSEKRLLKQISNRDEYDVRTVGDVMILNSKHKTTDKLVVMVPNQNLVDAVRELVRKHHSVVRRLPIVFKTLSAACSVKRLVSLSCGAIAAHIIVVLNDKLNNPASSDDHSLQVLKASLANVSSATAASLPLSSPSWVSPLFGTLITSIVNAILRSSTTFFQFLTINFAGGLMSTYLDAMASQHVRESLETELVLTMAMQNTDFIKQNVYSAMNALNASGDTITNLLGFVTTGSMYASSIRRIWHFPTIAVVTTLVDALQRWTFQQQHLAEALYYSAAHYESHPTITNNNGVNTNVESDRAPGVDPKPAAAELYVNSNINWLVDASKIYASNNIADRLEQIQFASIRSWYLDAAIPEGVSAQPAVNETSTSTISSSGRPRLLLEDVTSSRFPKMERIPTFGLYVLLCAARNHHVVSSEKANSKNDTAVCWIEIARVTEWIVEADAAKTAQWLMQEAVEKGDALESSLSSRLCAASQKRDLANIKTLIEDSLRCFGSTNAIVTGSDHNCVKHTVTPQTTSAVSESVRPDTVELPKISSRMLNNRDLIRAMRNAGVEREVVKACAISETCSVPKAAMSFISFGQITLRKSFQMLREFAAQVTGLTFHQESFVALPQMEARAVEASSSNFDGLVFNTSEPPVLYLSGTGRNITDNAQFASQLRKETDRRCPRGGNSATAMLAQCRGMATIHNMLVMGNDVTHRIDRPFSACTAQFHDALFSTSGKTASPAFDIEFRHVSKRFGRRKVLKDISFHVSKGEFVGIVGVSGAGKTTILNILLRLIEPDSGSVLINGVDIAEYPVRMLRRRIAVVCQDFKENGFSAEMDIESNLCLGDLSRDDVHVAVKEALCQADAQQFVGEKPLGLHTIAKSDLFSGGEAQRLVIARAMMRDPHRTGLLVLDEATSALDGATERKVVDGMLGGRRQANTTDRVSCIAVAHRLATLCEANKILVLEDGVIKEMGTWQQLATDRKSSFSKLLSLQTVRGEMEWANSNGSDHPSDTVACVPSLPSSGLSERQVQSMESMLADAGIDEVTKVKIQRLLEHNAKLLTQGSN